MPSLFCELLLVKGWPGNIRISVYASLGVNQCPADLWEPLDIEALTKEFYARLIIRNGPRHFMTDELKSFTEQGEVVSFQGLEMRKAAEIKRSSDGRGIQDRGAESAYTESTVERDTEYRFYAEKPVYELLSPEGNVYVMQSYSLEIDDTLTEDSLATLGERLNLPDGWEYRVRVLEQDLLMPSGGSAQVLQDELRNSYQLIK